ncbi:hypothetical protein [Microbacterium sp. TPD7012]|uniref:hypothetical protein n=1 Tax=Microbacterium sp. TPD7012 TaxID=2171975 RepID=UPI000D51442B|nr:hypothetical protein [Microbacterium sp. TPD7012]PVE92156.1 hypothetical protein DC434_18240 [Microbacterium sp. TPD7012]
MTALPPYRADAPASAPLGGHELSARFTGGASTAPPRKPKRKRTGLVLGLIGGAAVIAAIAITQVSASMGYDTAAESHADAVASANSEKTQLRAEAADLQALADSAGLIVAGENEAIVAPAETEAALAGAVAEAESAAAEADQLIATEVPVAGEKPVWFWELFGATTKLEEKRDEAADLADELLAEAADVLTASDAVTESGVALLTSAGEAAVAFEAAHISARNDAVIELRDAAAAAIATTTIDDAAVNAYASLQSAAAQVVATENEELAEKSGPLMDARLEIEAFARALAPGVLLEFDWAPIVNGAGFNGSMGGYTTWWWDEPGRSVIQLSDSVAEQWPADRSRALVAHEVGHAISVKCEDMYDSSTQDSIEKWATAWAISMGYTDDANGVWAYGYPPQSYIDAAAGCR